MARPANSADPWGNRSAIRLGFNRVRLDVVVVMMHSSFEVDSDDGQTGRVTEEIIISIKTN